MPHRKSPAFRGMLPLRATPWTGASSRRQISPSGSSRPGGGQRRSGFLERPAATGRTQHSAKEFNCGSRLLNRHQFAVPIDAPVGAIGELRSWEGVRRWPARNHIFDHGDHGRNRALRRTRSNGGTARERRGDQDNDAHPHRIRLLIARTAHGPAPRAALDERRQRTIHSSHPGRSEAGGDLFACSSRPRSGH